MKKKCSLIITVSKDWFHKDAKYKHYCRVHKVSFYAPIKRKTCKMGKISSNPRYWIVIPISKKQKILKAIK